MRLDPNQLYDSIKRFQTREKDSVLFMANGEKLTVWQGYPGFYKGLTVTGIDGNLDASFWVNARMIKDVLKLWPDELLDLDISEDRLSMKAYKTRLSYDLCKSGDWEVDGLSSPDGVPWNEVDASQFHNMISGLVAFSNTRDGREICQNVRLCDGEAIATDGVRFISMKTGIDSH